MEINRGMGWEWLETEPEKRGAENWLREELETAWLRGYLSGGLSALDTPSFAEVEQIAADYAERVVGGATRPERPEVER